MQLYITINAHCLDIKVDGNLKGYAVDFDVYFGKFYDGAFLSYEFPNYGGLALEPVDDVDSIKYGAELVSNALTTYLKANVQ